MPNAAPNLWPLDQIDVNARTPCAILTGQAEYLRQFTQERLLGEIETKRSPDGWLQHRFVLVAPALQFRQHILLAAHAEGMVYPARLEADCLLPELPTDTVKNPLLLATEKQFLEVVGQVFRSRQVQGLVQSLLARSNEQQV